MAVKNTVLRRGMVIRILNASGLFGKVSVCRTEIRRAKRVAGRSPAICCSPANAGISPSQPHRLDGFDERLRVAVQHSEQVHRPVAKASEADNFPLRKLER